MIPDLVDSTREEEALGSGLAMPLFRGRLL